MAKRADGQGAEMPTGPMVYVMLGSTASFHIALTTWFGQVDHPSLYFLPSLAVAATLLGLGYARPVPGRSWPLDRRAVWTFVGGAVASAAGVVDAFQNSEIGHIAACTIQAIAVLSVAVFCSFGLSLRLRTGESTS